MHFQVEYVPDQRADGRIDGLFIMVPDTTDRHSRGWPPARPLRSLSGQPAAPATLRGSVHVIAYSGSTLSAAENSSTR